MAFAENNGLETKDPEQIALHLAAMPKKNSKRPRYAVITQGAHPTIVAVDGKVCVCARAFS